MLLRAGEDSSKRSNFSFLLALIVLIMYFCIQVQAVGAQSASRAGEWQNVPSPDLGEWGGEITGLAVISAEDAWIVGEFHELLDEGPGVTHRDLTHILVQHWDGNRWHTVTTPDGSSHLKDGAYLRSVRAFATDDVWAVGAYADATIGFQPLALHWNGTAWHIVPTPKLTPPPGWSLFSELAGVEVVSANDVWAVGHDGNQTLTMHWDGVKWRIIPSPNTAKGDGELRGVAAVSTNDVWAVGNGQRAQGAEFLLLHWDGAAWNLMKPPTYRKTGSDFLNEVAVISTNDIWAVGYSGTHRDEAEAVTLHWDGMGWTVVPPSPGAGTLWDVAAAPNGRVWAVGDVAGGRLQESRSLIMRWHKNQWLQVETPNPGNYWNQFISVAVSGSEVWAVGSYSSSDSGGMMILRSGGAGDASPGMPRSGGSTPAQGVPILLALHLAVLLLLSGIIFRAMLPAAYSSGRLR